MSNNPISYDPSKEQTLEILDLLLHGEGWVDVTLDARFIPGTLLALENSGLIESKRYLKPDGQVHDGIWVTEVRLTDKGSHYLLENIPAGKQSSDVDLSVETLLEHWSPKYMQIVLDALGMDRTAIATNRVSLTEIRDIIRIAIDLYERHQVDQAELVLERAATDEYKRQLQVYRTIEADALAIQYNNGRLTAERNHAQAELDVTRRSYGYIANELDAAYSLIHFAVGHYNPVGDMNRVTQDWRQELDDAQAALDNLGVPKMESVTARIIWLRDLGVKALIDQQVERWNQNGTPKKSG